VGTRREVCILYSTNGTDFIPFGEPYQLMWGNYRGDRIGIFTYNDKGEYGYADFDYLRYDYKSIAPTIY